MDDEASKLSETPDSGQPFSIHPSHVQPSLKSDKSDSSADTVFSRFVQKIALAFNRSQAEADNETKLNGRIKELQTMADGVFFDLLEFKKKIENKIDPNLFALVAATIDPLIKEAGRVPPVIEKKDNTAQQVKLFSRYVDSIEKAKSWIEIGKTNNGDQESLEHALVQQTATEFLLRIDRDIQVIQDYLSLALSSFEMTTTLEKEIQNKLMPGLSPKMQELRQLKTLPEDFSLNSFIQWRSRSDLARETIFGTALHIIDGFSDEFLPSPKKETESEHTQAILEDMHALENKVNKLSFDIRNDGFVDENERKAYITMIEKLEVEAHQLNANLRLSHEHGERIESYLEILLQLRDDLSF